MQTWTSLRCRILAALLCSAAAFAVTPGCASPPPARAALPTPGTPGTSETADASGTFPRELFLAGGALRTCSSLATRDCRDPSAVASATHRAPPQVWLDAAGIAAALDPLLWRERDPRRAASAQALAYAQRKLGSAPQSADALRDLLARTCVQADSARACAAGDAGAPWSRLDDDQRGAMQAALEVGQFADDGQRLREVAALDQARNLHGARILRAFVAAARARAGGGVPRIAVVTASAYDPFDPVDVYLDALRQAGAQVQWWPVDGALAAALFESGDCAALPALRRTRLHLPGRERVYPDLVAQQAAACVAPAALAAVPAQVHGMFFAGGDQWKLRAAFVDAHGQPNAWLQSLRAAAASGALVIGGTSAGSAVQSGGPMLSNGTTGHALSHGAIASPPPRPGCARAGDCVGGLDEDAFTYTAHGGLGLAPDWTVDTHFSERAREPRLLRLLADSGQRWGVGVDETSALWMRWHDDGQVAIEALGASGGWLFDAARACKGDAIQARVHYLAPGAVARVAADGVRIDGALVSHLDRAAPSVPDSALDDAALRQAAQGLATGRDRATLAAGTATATLARTPQSRAWLGDNGLAGISDLLLRLAPVPACAR